MPTFRTGPSLDLKASIKRAMASSGMTPLAEMQGDLMGAQVARQRGLAEEAFASAQKERQKAEAERRSVSDRADPALATEFAGNVAGMDMPTASRMSNHIRGVLEQPAPGDVDDAAAAGMDAQPYVTGAPNVTPGQRRQFQGAIASLIANRVGTGNTNADQLTQAAGNLQKQSLIEEAAAAPDIPSGNRIVSAISGKLREPFKTNAQGTVLNEETGDLNENTSLAGVFRKKVTAETEKERAAAGRDRAHAGLYGAQADNARQGGKAPTGYMWGPMNEQGQATLVKIPGGPAEQGKALPTSAAQKLMENQQNLRRAEEAVALLSGQSVAGVPGDKNATGNRGFLTYLGAPGENLLNALDPAGVNTRAAVSDLGSMVIHDRSGAAVTASEFPRLRPFIPLSTDSPEVALKKAQRFVQEYRAITEEAADFYKQSGYNVPTEALRSNAPKAQGAKAGSKAAAPSRAAPPVNGKGWPLMTDAQGNRAYVSPDGKSFEEAQ